MGLPIFDADKHHIGFVFPTSPRFYGFVIDGVYRKAFRRQIASEFDGVRYGGGDSLVNKPGVSSWTMDDFTGGAFQYVWGKDQAQFARSTNILPSQFDRSLRSVPSLQQWMNGKRLATTEDPLLVVPYNGYVHAVFQTSVQRWTMANGTLSSTSPGHTSGGQHSAWIHKDGGVLYHAKDDEIARLNLATFTTFEDSWVTHTDAHGNVVGGAAEGDRVVMSIDDVLWVVNIPDNPADVPQMDDWVRIGRLPGRWVDSCVSSGLTYVLLASLDQQTELVAFDGTQILPICTFPYNFQGQSLCSYGGRLFVGGSGLDIQTGAPRYAELFEVTGASVRLLKTFAPETRQPETWIPNSIPTMTVHEGLLFFGLRGLGLQAYDLTTDSFYGASLYSPVDAAADVRHLISARDSLMAWVYPITANTGDSGWFRPATSQETVATYDSQIETSDFATAFDRKKRWKQLRVLSRYVTGNMTIYYSVDGGNTFVSLPDIVKEANGRTQLWTVPLDVVPESRSIRFRFHVPSGTDVAAFREFVAFTASFRMSDSDSVGSGEKEKLGWTFTITAAQLQEQADGSTEENDVLAIQTSLWSAARDRTELKFRDVDGTEYQVEIDTLEETQPWVLKPIEGGNQPPVDVPDREAHFRVVLVEK